MTHEENTGFTLNLPFPCLKMDDDVFGRSRRVHGARDGIK